MPNDDIATKSANNHPQGKSNRLHSLDAFRGMVVLMMASGGLGMANVASSFPQSSWIQRVGRQTEHAAWQGCTLWDLIQPAFMFMVGVALPWSLEKRRTSGERFPRLLCHALWRSLLLVLIAIFLTSAWSPQTEWVFTNVLAQIGLGYPILFLLGFASDRVVWATALGILVANWGAFAMFPTPSPDFAWDSVGVPEAWNFLTGFESHWEKNANIAAWWDRWFLNLFPREKPFEFSSGGYQTLNFIPSIATMAFGLLSGRALLPPANVGRAAGSIACVGLVGMIVGVGLDYAGVCPMVKRIWTPSFVLFSSGAVALALSLFVLVIDLAQMRRWAFVFVIAGMNPLALYCLWQLSSGFIRKQTSIHLGSSFFHFLGDAWKPALERGWVLFVLWCIVAWMYRRRIFLRV